MYSDVLIIPAIYAIYVLSNAALRSLGIHNKIVLLAFIYIFSHLFFVLLMYFQLYNCSYNEIEKLNYSNFMAVIKSIMLVLFYIFMAITPVFRYLFFPLTYLPKANLWLDHFIVSLPIIFIHVIERYALEHSFNCAE